MEAEALGLPLTGFPDIEGYTISPISVLVIMRGIDSNGNETSGVYASEGMTALEGAGMARLAALYCESNLRAAANLP